ncbi:AAA family ATPase [Campylobacter sp.]|uniref:AAA family ATPase n=2 Tax=Campylobacter TaxID=194 RepID=UPI0025D46E2D|nr:AAA family ATPase [Campylobacter sp.]
MELVYLWIEKHKNIEKQGFNLGSKFKCKYDYEKNELTIDENPNYIDIFPDNIKVNALIGSNGSGKSSIVEFILLSMLAYKGGSGTEIPSSGWLLIYDKKKEKFFIYLSDDVNPRLEKPKINPNYSKNYSEDLGKEKFFNILYNPSIEMPSTFITRYKDLAYLLYSDDQKPTDIANAFLFPDKTNGILDIRQAYNKYLLNMFKIKNNKEIGIKKVLNGIFKDKKNLEFIPHNIKISLNQSVLESRISNATVRNIVLQLKLSLSIESLKKYLFAFIISMNNQDNESDKIKTYFFKNEGSDLELELQELYHKPRVLNKDKNKFEGFVRELLSSSWIEEHLQNKKNLTSLFRENSNALHKDVYELAKLIDAMEKYRKLDLMKFKSGSDDELNDILSSLPSFIDLDVIDETGRHFSDFSFGEKTILSLIYSLIFYIDFYHKDGKEIFNIILDEAENGLHPLWQKELFNLIIKLLENFKDLKFLLILTSHSPFIISDIPNENIIFLKDGKQVYPDINTFGANIHTLLANAFFMNNGLMGNFAKEKIDNVINILKKPWLNNDEIKGCENIISLIGEPILKAKLRQMLNDARIHKIDEIDIIKNDIKKLEKRIQELEEND